MFLLKVIIVKAFSTTTLNWSYHWTSMSNLDSRRAERSWNVLETCDIVDMLKWLQHQALQTSYIIPSILSIITDMFTSLGWPEYFAVTNTVELSTPLNLIAQSHYQDLFWSRWWCSYVKKYILEGY